MSPLQLLERSASANDPVLVVVPVLLKPPPLLHRVEKNRSNIDVVIV